jgi:hypothetical protein
VPSEVCWLLKTAARACIRPEKKVKKEDEGEEDSDSTPEQRSVEPSKPHLWKGLGFRIREQRLVTEVATHERRVKPLLSFTLAPTIQADPFFYISTNHIYGWY